MLCCNRLAVIPVFFVPPTANRISNYICVHCTSINFPLLFLSCVNGFWASLWRAILLRVIVSWQAQYTVYFWVRNVFSTALRDSKWRRRFPCVRIGRAKYTNCNWKLDSNFSSFDSASNNSSPIRRRLQSTVLLSKSWRIRTDGFWAWGLPQSIHPGDPWNGNTVNPPFRLYTLEMAYSPFLDMLLKRSLYPSPTLMHQSDLNVLVLRLFLGKTLEAWLYWLKEVVWRTGQLY